MSEVEVVRPSGLGGTICCDPYRNVHRFVVLVFMCFISFGSYYCYDNPAALEDLMKRDLDLTTTQYGVFYTVYSWPNVVFPLVGGYLIDRVFGVRLGSILFAGFIMAGQVVFSGGAMAKSYWLMILGRVIFSVGGENLAVCQNNYAVKWFKGKELNTVFGIQLSFARVGSTVNMYAMRPLYAAVEAFRVSTTTTYLTLGWTLMIGGTSTIVSFLCALILAFFDRRNDKFLRIRADSDPLLEPAPAEESIKLSDVKSFSLSFWLLCIICVAYYNTIFPLVGFGLVFYMSKFGLHPLAADACNSLIYLVSIGASPMCGMLVDYYGRNVMWMFVSVLLTFLGHALLAFTFLTPYVAVVILGMGYSLLAASLWPSVAYVIPERALGTAYGAMQSIQNLGLGVLFIAAGAIVDASGYLMLEIFFLAWLCITLGCCVLLYFADKAENGVLNMPRDDRNNFLKKQAMESKEQ